MLTIVEVGGPEFLAMCVCNYEVWNLTLKLNLFLSVVAKTSDLCVGNLVLKVIGYF